MCHSTCNPPPVPAQVLRHFGLSDTAKALGLMDPIVVIAEEQHYGTLHAALDSVAREKRFLAATEAPPFDRSVAFYRELAEHGMAHYVALDGESVVGWGDVARTFGQARAHMGLLGIGLIKEARHQGLGKRLLEAAIAHSWKQGLSPIELTVRADNLNAIRLYERLGFEHEGVMRRGCSVDGHFYDMHFMALLRDDA